MSLLGKNCFGPKPDIVLPKAFSPHLSIIHSITFITNQTHSPFQYPFQTTSTLPPLSTIQTKHKNSHGLIGTPSLLLRTSSLGALAPSARKQTRLLQIPLDAALLVDLVFVGLLPIESSRVLEVLDHFLRGLGLFFGL
jgi:hypothetical protein